MYLSWWEKLIGIVFIGGLAFIIIGLGIVIHESCVNNTMAHAALQEAGYNAADVSAFCTIYHVDEYAVYSSPAMQKALNRFIGKGEIMPHTIPVSHGKHTDYVPIPGN